jgi:chromate transport protein ChrA
MVAFRGPTYALLLSLLALVLAQYAYMLSVFSLMHGVKFATGYVMLISVLKFTRKLLNNLTDRS